MSEDFASINRELWNAKTEVHVTSEFYDVEGFKKSKQSLNSIELDLFKDLSGKRVLHLQCHFGQDTLSLAHMGAQATGVDLSDKAIDFARTMAKDMDIEAEFVCCNVYDLKDHLNGEYDIVFTSYGTIGWLPDLNKWADIIHHFLKPGGQFVFVEFHPVVWMFDDQFKEIAYSYFNTQDYEEESTGTYTDRDAPIQNKACFWNHDLGEVFQALKGNGMQVIDFQEYDYSPYNCFENTVKVETGYQIKGLEGKLPMVYSLVAEKRP